jgi:hypothetical protein
MIQRIRDWLHEHKLRRLSHLCAEAMASGQRDQAIYFWQAQCKAIKERSAQQIARMERRMGIK